MVQHPELRHMQIPSLPETTCVTLSKLFTFSEPPFLHLWKVIEKSMKKNACKSPDVRGWGTKNSDFVGAEGEEFI